MNIYALLSLISFFLFVQASAIVLIKNHRLKTYRLFALLSVLFAFFALGNFLYFGTTDIAKVYIYDRIAAIGWVFFPVVAVWFFMEFTRNSSKVTKSVFFFFQIPISLFTFYIALFRLEEFKYFYDFNGIWYYTPNDQTIVYYFFVSYLVSCVLLVFFMLIRWYYSATLNQYKLQAKTMLMTLIAFFLTSFLSSIILPLLGSQLVPALGPVTALILVGGGAYTLLYLPVEVITSDIIYKLLINHLKEFIFILDRKGHMYATNAFTLSNLGYNNYDFFKTDSSALLSSYDKVKKLIGSMGSRVVSPQIRVDLNTHGGKTIPVLLSVIKILGSYGSVHGYVLACMDYRQKLKLKEEVTERVRAEKNLYQIRRELEFLVQKRTQELQEANMKLQQEVIERRRAEQQIKSDLEEKIELVKEVHHRVKNNIQMIISLINMLCSHPRIDHQSSEKLRELAEKVRYISRIHEDFYSAPNLSSIAFARYLKKALGELYSNYGSGMDLVFKLNISEEYLDINQAIPLGIIFNELMLNILKHAFRSEDYLQNKKKIINIDFYKKQETLTLLVGDNGVGLPETLLQRKNQKTGLQLIDILVKEHLKGDIICNSSSGTSFKVSFNA